MHNFFQTYYQQHAKPCVLKTKLYVQCLEEYEYLV